MKRGKKEGALEEVLAQKHMKNFTSSSATPDSDLAGEQQRLTFAAEGKPEETECEKPVTTQTELNDKYKELISQINKQTKLD